jgi:hypothetical protein
MSINVDIYIYRRLNKVMMASPPPSCLTDDDDDDVYLDRIT